MKKKTDEKPLYPICIRFKRRDLTLVRQAAAKDGEIVTVWIREAVQFRLSQIDLAATLSPLRFETAGGDGEPVSVRFLKKVDFLRATRAATQDQQHLSSWVRAVAVDRATKMLAAPVAAA